MLPYLLGSFTTLLLLANAHQIPLRASSSSPFTADFDQLVVDSVDRWHCTGLSVAVIDGDETYSKAYGMARLTPSQSLAPETLLYTASTTKSFTAAAAALILAESTNQSAIEALSWDTPLANVIREDFVLQDEYTTLHATLEDALSHRTGMPRHDLSYGDQNYAVRDVARNLRNLPLSAEIRTKWQYCNMMYMAVSHFIQTWTGIGLGDFLRERIYQPLGMNSTFFSLKEAKAAASAGGEGLATPYYWRNYTQEYIELAQVDVSQEHVPSGAGATISNVLDYTKWLRCHMTRSPPLSPSAHTQLHTPRMIIPTPEGYRAGFRGSESYALGWQISNYRGEMMHWHTGGIPGYVTIMLYFPRLQWGMTAMGNGGVGEAQLIASFRLVDDMLGIKEGERFDWGASFELRNALALERLKNAEAELYPNIPKGENAIPLPLPLESYAGSYTNPGYPTFHLTLPPNNTTPLTPLTPLTLHSTLNYSVWPIHFTFRHISASYFLLYARFFATSPPAADDDLEPPFDVVSKAEFRLDEAGEVAEMGLQLEAELGGKKIWFRKDGDVGGKQAGDGEPFGALPGLFRLKMAPLFE